MWNWRMFTLLVRSRQFYLFLNNLSILYVMIALIPNWRQKSFPAFQYIAIINY